MMNKRNVAKSVGVWMVTLLLVVLFGLQGFRKFPSDSGWAAMFAQWGLPVWLRYVVGVAEMTAAALLLWRRTAAYGALLVIGVMLGAIGTLLVNGAMRGSPAAIVALLLGIIVAWGRWGDRLRPEVRSRMTA